MTIPVWITERFRRVLASIDLWLRSPEFKLLWFKSPWGQGRDAARR